MDMETIDASRIESKVCVYLLPVFLCGRIYFHPVQVHTMKISCESCGSEDWKMVIHEVRVPGGVVIYSAMKCDSCEMVYPVQEVAKGRGMQVSKDTVIGMLKR